MIHFFKDKQPTLEEAQAIVGGLVEMVPLMNPQKMQLLINEEGLMHDPSKKAHYPTHKMISG